MKRLFLGAAKGNPHVQTQEDKEIQNALPKGVYSWGVKLVLI